MAVEWVLEAGIRGLLSRLLKNAPGLCVSARRQDLRRCATSFVIAAYGLYASFLRIRAPCISSFLNSLSEMLSFNGLIGVAVWDYIRG